MKKYYFFFLLISSVNYLNAQQTNRPLFRDFMNKRNEFSTGPIEKIIVNPEAKISKRKYFREVQTNSPVARLSHVLPNGNKVYILPQDNMPCVVPDTRAYNMPVGWGNVNTDEGIYAIPPQRIIPFSDSPLLPQQQTTGKK